MKVNKPKSIFFVQIFYKKDTQKIITFKYRHFLLIGIEKAFVNQFFQSKLLNF